MRFGNINSRRTRFVCISRERERERERGRSKTAARLRGAFQRLEEEAKNGKKKHFLGEIQLDTGQGGEGRDEERHETDGRIKRGFFRRSPRFIQTFRPIELAAGTLVDRPATKQHRAVSSPPCNSIIVATGLATSGFPVLMEKRPTSSLFFLSLSRPAFSVSRR